MVKNWIDIFWKELGYVLLIGNIKFSSVHAYSQWLETQKSRKDFSCLSIETVSIQYSIQVQTLKEKRKEGGGKKKTLNLSLPSIHFYKFIFKAKHKTSKENSYSNVNTKDDILYRVNVGSHLHGHFFFLTPGTMVQILSWTGIWTQNSGLHGIHLFVKVNIGCPKNVCIL